MECEELKRVRMLSRHFVGKLMVASQSVACFLWLGLLSFAPFELKHLQIQEVIGMQSFTSFVCASDSLI